MLFCVTWLSEADCTPHDLCDGRTPSPVPSNVELGTDNSIRPKKSGVEEHLRHYAAMKKAAISKWEIPALPR